MIRSEVETTTQSLDPGLAALMGNRVDEVDAHVGDAHRAGQLESSGRLRGVRLALEHRQRARLEALHPKAQTVDAAVEPGGHARFIGAGGVGLEGHLRLREDIERGADEPQQTCDQLGREQARRSAPEVHRFQRRKFPAILARCGQLSLQGADVIGHEPVHPGVSVEIAVPALVLAEGNVNV